MVLIGVPTAPLPIQHPTNVSMNTVEDGLMLGPLSPMGETWMELLPPGFDLPQP